jgi:hypothetical protein
MASLICNGCGDTIPAHHDIPHLHECAHHTFGGGWGACSHAGNCYRNADEVAA